MCELQPKVLRNELKCLEKKIHKQLFAVSIFPPEKNGLNDCFIAHFFFEK